MLTKTGLSVMIRIFLLLSLVLVSCGTAEKAAVPCPDFSSGKSYNGRVIHKKTNKKPHSALHTGTLKSKKKEIHFESLAYDKQLALESENAYQRNNSDDLEYVNSLTASIENVNHPLLHKVTVSDATSAIQTRQGNEGVTYQQEACDTIILKTGDFIIGKVTNIGQDGIEYRNCGKADGPVASLKTSEIFVIKYPNGNRDFFSSTSPVANNNYASANMSGTSNVGSYDTRKNEGLGKTAFILSLVGLMICGIPCGVLALVFGGISLSKINKFPERYKGKGFAVAGIFIGLADIIGVLIILSTL